MKKDLLDTTFLLPVRITDETRKNNLYAVFHYLIRHLDVHINIGEYDTSPKVPDILGDVLHFKNVFYIFEPAQSDVFHKTKLLNKLVKYAKTPIIAEYDIDLISDVDSYVINRNYIRSGEYEYVVMYEKIFRVSQQEIPLFLQHWNPKLLNVIGEMPPAPGSIAWCLRSKYIECGGHNEMCVGWGREDRERHLRFLKLGLKTKTPATGYLWHFEHQVQKNRPLTQQKNDYYYQLLLNETPEQTKTRIEKTFYWLKDLRS